MSKIIKKMTSMATRTQETAEGQFYCITRGGKEIRGPSVRLAEIATTCYGNISAAAREIANDGKTITVQAVCHDLENNVRISVEVKRKITDKNGKIFSEDMQVVTGNAARSIALRNAIFKVIPGSIIEEVYAAARQCAVGDSKTLIERRTRAMESFAKMGATEARVLAAIGKPSVDDIDLETLEKLTGIRTAIKDGDTTVDEAFPAPIAKAPIFKDKKPETASTTQPGEGGSAECLAPDKTAPEPGAPSTSAQLEKLLQSLMDKDAVTPEELGRTLKSFGVQIPRKFTGPSDLTDTVLADTIKGWNDYLPVIKAGRGA